jgi:RNA polymerase sigma-70 factor, ECF subfamily
MAVTSDRHAGRSATAGAETPLQVLVEQARAGDAPAFRALFDRYHDRLYRYAYLRLGSEDDARDAAQETFVSVWRGLDSFTYEHEGSFPAWLFRIASRRVGDRLRAAGRRSPDVPLDETTRDTVEFEGALLSRRVVVQALGRLHDRQREVVVLRFLVGLSVREVAQATDRTEKSVEALQMRGLARLRRYMDESDAS